jgi:hypothetical protein
MFDKLLIERKNMIHNYKSEMRIIDKNTKLMRQIHRVNSDVASAQKQIDALRKRRELQKNITD